MSELDTRIQRFETRLSHFDDVMEKFTSMLNPSTNTTEGAKRHLRRKHSNRGSRWSDSTAHSLLNELRNIHQELTVELGHIKRMNMQPPAISDQQQTSPDDPSESPRPSTGRQLLSQSVVNDTEQSCVDAQADGNMPPLVDELEPERPSLADHEQEHTTVHCSRPDVIEGPESQEVISSSGAQQNPPTDTTTADTTLATDTTNNTSTDTISTDTTDNTSRNTTVATDTTDNISTDTTSADTTDNTSRDTTLATDNTENISTGTTSADTTDNTSTDTTVNMSIDITSASWITASDLPSSPLNTPVFALTPDEMGEKLVPALLEFMKRPDFSGLVSVPLSKLDPQSFRDHMRLKHSDYMSNQYHASSGGRGYVHMRTIEQSEFIWPDFEPIQKPTDAEAEQFLEETVINPPKNPISYYGGGASGFPDEKLHPGDALAELGPLEFINSEYYHIGSRGSSTCFHCEDGNLGSYNKVESGWKIFLFIQKHHTDKFEKFIRDTWGGCTCGQFVRHHDLLIAPSRLRREGIDFNIQIAGPGDMIVTGQREYHCVVNYSSCFARSINFLPPGETIVSKGHPVCKGCGLYNLDDEHIQIVAPPSGTITPTRTTPQVRKSCKRKAADSLPGRQPKITRAQRDRDELLQQLRKKDTLCRTPEIDLSDPPSLEALELAVVIRSSKAMGQFISLVHEWRERHDYKTISDSTEDLIQQHAGCLKDSIGKSDLNTFRRRLFQMSLAREVDRDKADKHKVTGWRQRVKSDAIDDIAQQTGWSKANVNFYISEGRKWIQVCGPYNGLLSFIFLGQNTFGITQKRWLELGDADLSAFHHLLDDDYVADICSAGKALEKIVMFGAPEVFVWEGEEQDIKFLMDHAGTLNTITESNTDGVSLQMAAD